MLSPQGGRQQNPCYAAPRRVPGSLRTGLNFSITSSPLPCCWPQRGPRWQSTAHSSTKGIVTSATPRRFHGKQRRELTAHMTFYFHLWRDTNAGARKRLVKPGHCSAPAPLLCWEREKAPEHLQCFIRHVQEIQDTLLGSCQPHHMPGTLPQSTQHPRHLAPQGELVCVRRSPVLVQPKNSRGCPTPLIRVSECRRR